MTTVAVPRPEADWYLRSRSSMAAALGVRRGEPAIPRASGSTVRGSHPSGTYAYLWTCNPV